MSDTDVGPRSPRKSTVDRTKTAGEIATLLRLAELDATRLDRPDERRGLAAKLTPETLEAYHRALRAGRQPTVVRLVASVCSGCHMRLHSKLDHQVRQRRGVAACPHCLRLVYDPAWLTP
jgi:predicted  nucleic acid-binding Zn-ribbon protein